MKTGEVGQHARGLKIHTHVNEQFPHRRYLFNLIAKSTPRVRIFPRSSVGRFRDSHGGVAYADAGSRTGGERTVGDAVVARYVAAATVLLTLDGGESRTLVAIAREAAATGKRALATWFADKGGRFSAHSPEFASILSRQLGLPTHGSE